jgi:hypothetical protein
MSSVRSVDEVAGEFSSTFSGQLLRPADAGYEEARRVHNGLVDKRPALIARCRGAADVVDAVNLTRKLGLEVAVRGGGHNVAGRATIDGGLVIDLSPMKGIHVDPKGRTVRAQGGVTWAELNRETQLHGLAVMRGCFKHRDRWAHPEWWAGLVNGQVWPRPRQSSIRRTRHRRR